MKKTVLTFLILVGFTMQTFAYDFQSGDLLYTIISTDPPCVRLDGHVDGTEAQGELVIPESVVYEGEIYTVSSIKRKAFYHCRNLTGNLVIPNTITSISIEAFSYCSGFTGDLVISNSLIELGTDNLPGGATFEGAFEGCDGFSRLVLGESLEKIGCLCFSDCSGFTGQLQLPDRINEIWDCAFAGCCGFNGELVFPDSLKVIGSSAFISCSGFTGKLEFPDALERIGNNAFAWCSGFSDVELLHQVFFQHGFGEGIFKGWNFTSVDIPEGWTIIENRTFASCTNLKKIYLPESLTVIGQYVFDECCNLEEIVFSEGLKSIEAGAFDGCKRLKSIKLPQSLITIHGWAFRRSGLSGDVFIPDTVERVEVHAFDSCTYITRIVLGESVNYLAEPAFRNTHLESMVIKAAVPPELDYFSTPTNISVDLPIYVPCGTLEAYQNADGWCEFTNIREGVTDILSLLSSDESVGIASILKEATCEDRTVEVEAIPNEGCAFMYWVANGEQVSSENPYSFMLEEDMELVAYFSGTGMDEREQMFVVYPNPARETVTIEGIEVAEVQVYNALGQLVKSVRGTNEINVGDLPEGVYLLHITDKEGNTFSERIVKE